MSGAITATTIIAGAALAVGAAGVGYTIAAGEDAKRKQADALRKQESAQKQAVASAEKQSQQSQQLVNRANQKRPDVSSIMQAAADSSKGGAAGTMLTGPTGVDPNSLALGKSSLLGS